MARPKVITLIEWWQKQAALVILVNVTFELG